MTNTTPLLEANDLRLRLRTHAGTVDAVRGVNLSLRRGETLGLVGESGCGKSLTAMTLMGLHPEGATVSGSLRFHGEEMIGQSEARWCALRGDRIGMVFQEPMSALNPVHTVGHQVAEPLRLHRGLTAAAARKEAVALLDRVGIADAARRFDAWPHQFSGGQRQRITIAMALACGPDLLIADEPTTALDVTIAGQILQLIRDLVRERDMGLILISHDLGVIAQNVSHMMVMYGGMVVESGPTREVFSRRAHPYTQGLFGSRPQLGPQAHTGSGARARLAAIPGNVPELRNMPAGCPFADRCVVSLPACQGEMPPLIQLGQDHCARCVLLESAG
jgi:peptide/nickel transport system ATP-binding protein